MENSLLGGLFIYDKVNDLVCFSNQVKSNINLILVGGLNFNLLSIPYTKDLLNYCNLKHFGFFVPQFRSHPNYGLFNLDNDIEDLRSLLQHITGRIVLIGNSTGCQVILKYIESNFHVSLCFLQGPVSDVEYEKSIDSELDNKLKVAEHCESSVLPFRHEGKLISPQRYLDLFKCHGYEDMFSSYLEDDFYRLKLNPFGLKCIFIVSECDEYVVVSVKGKLKMIRNSLIYEIKAGDHFLTNEVHRHELVRIIDKEINLLDDF